MRLTKQEALRLQGHIHLIFEILKKYEKTSEPYDQIDRINAKAHEIEADLDI